MKLSPGRIAFTSYTVGMFAIYRIAPGATFEFMFWLWVGGLCLVGFAYGVAATMHSVQD